MGKVILDRVRTDLAAINPGRTLAGLPPYPPPCHQWVIHPFKTDRKMHQSLERRGYVLLQDLLGEDPACALSFPPHREIYIPRECK